MSTNKHATIRYQALDKCFSNRFRMFYMEDLIEACDQAIYNYAGIKNGVKRRQIFSDIAYMESEQGWSILLERHKDGRRVYYRYEDKDFSINSQPLTDSEVNQLRETMLMLNRFKGMPQFEWMEELLSKLEDKLHLKGVAKSFIGFEHNPYLIGLSHLSTLFNAIINKQVLAITYQAYGKSAEKWTIHPYYLKQYNSRWFLLGLNEKFDTISNLPLDRIIEIKETRHTYKETDIDFEEYFDDVVGMTIPTDGKIEQILLKFSPERLPYVLSKPLHPTQKVKDKKEGLIEISVIPNRELESLVLSFGSDIEVISPESFRKEIQDKIKKLYKEIYQCK